MNKKSFISKSSHISSKQIGSLGEKPWDETESKKKPFQLLVQEHNLLIFHITLCSLPLFWLFDHSTRERKVKGESAFGWKWGGRKMRCDIWQNFLLYKFCFHSLMALKTIFSRCRVVSQAEKINLPLQCVRKYLRWVKNMFIYLMV